MSDLDQSLTLKRLGVLDLRDNVSNIYAKPLTSVLVDQLNADKRWDAIAITDSVTIEDLEDKPAKAQEILKKTKLDGLVAGRISKGPQGLSLRLALFTGPSGDPLTVENSPEENIFELSEVRKKLEVASNNLMKSVPYRGLILSRRGSVVTVNLGTKQGVHNQDELTVVQIFKLHRHPRFKFVVGSDQVVLGKILVTKSEENLSFGQIVSERETGSISPLAKVLTEEMKNSPQPVFDDRGKLVSKEQQSVAFGDNPQEWKLPRKPAFGKVGILFGLGSYAINNTLDVGSANSTQSTVPAILVNGEMWLNPNWFLDLNLRQTVFRVANSYPAGESSPSRLSVSSNISLLRGGYNFLLHDEFFGPKLSLSLGLSRSAMTVDNSMPTAFTSQVYNSMVFGFGGGVPVDLESGKKLTLGGELLYHWRPVMSEAPVYSGEVRSNQVSSFQGYASYHINQRLAARGQLNIDSYSSSLNNAGDRVNSATSLSQTMTFFFGGIEYSF